MPGSVFVPGIVFIPLWCGLWFRSVMVFLKVWVEQYPGDFASPLIKAQLESFLSQHHRDSTTADELLKTVTSLKDREPQSSCKKEKEEEEEEMSKEDFSPFSLPPPKFAMGLTALESVSFKNTW